MQKELADTKEAPGTSSSDRREKRTGTQEIAPEETIGDEITEAAGHTCFTF